MLSAISALLVAVTFFIPVQAPVDSRLAVGTPGAPGAPRADSPSDGGASDASGRADAADRTDPTDTGGTAIAGEAVGAEANEPISPGLAAASRSRLAVVIDDVGNNMEDLVPFLTLPGPLTFAVLPHLPSSLAAAEAVRAAGHRLILHAPMQTADDVEPGPGTITVAHELLDVWEELAGAFESIANAPGANNHMGSRLTADPVAMDAVMAYFAATGRFFLDSRTTAGTVAEHYASLHGVPFVRRDVFLDNHRQVAAIEEAFDAGLALARESGQATLIGHAASFELYTVLSRRLPALTSDGMVLVGVDELARREFEVEVALAGADSGRVERP